MPQVANHSSLQHQLEYELWLKELGYLNDEINILKRHLPDIYYKDHSEEVMELVKHYSETFRMQKDWLHKMKEEIEQNNSQHRAQEAETVSNPGNSQFRLQMQANRLVNQELKDSFFKLFS